LIFYVDGQWWRDVNRPSSYIYSKGTIDEPFINHKWISLRINIQQQLGFDDSFSHINIRSRNINRLPHVLYINYASRKCCADGSIIIHASCLATAEKSAPSTNITRTHETWWLKNEIWLHCWLHVQFSSFKNWEVQRRAKVRCNREQILNSYFNKNEVQRRASLDYISFIAMMMMGKIPAGFARAKFIPLFFCGPKWRIRVYHHVISR